MKKVILRFTISLLGLSILLWSPRPYLFYPVKIVLFVAFVLTSSWRRIGSINKRQHAKSVV